MSCFFPFDPGKNKLGDRYSSVFCGICHRYAFTTVYSVMALEIGLLAIASLVLSYSLIIPFILTFIISVFAYREKFIPRQIAELACGLASLVILNI